LYFFGGEQVAVVSHGLSKEGKVPEGDIAKALARKVEYGQDPELHS
jgi:DNA-binding XRE family transcriptional regulator